MRTVNRIYTPAPKHWVGDGFFVRQLFSHMGEDRQTNPFLMLDYAAPHEYAPNRHNPRGVGQHPHKGFETVTIAYQGEVEHRDSSGSGGVLRPGDVQWMTAGNGIIHQEFHSKAFSQQGGVFEMVQLWVNLPKAHKQHPPRYQHLASETIPVYNLDENAGSIRLIAGQLYDTHGAARTFTELNVWDITLNENAKVRLPVPSNHNLSLVVLRGDITIGDHIARTGELVSFHHDGDEIELNSPHGAKVLLLSGVPIDEPVVGYGPFVMNSKEEIRQAIADFNAGKFGQIPA
ncbi:pirin family protein [Spirabiliibacterium falconis]|uniref:pirin family protein n=1 Tax=Spirabiliibacterium falconis TaxID=572023 RepID=UPI001AADB485|nr:pirin family protein [Spirabiliibacterium falconis]MBE2894693.1 pirin family protein [Spirabiliibacterium falconis]